MKTKFGFFMAVFVFAAILFCGCGKKSGRTLTSATGTIYECLVVMNENPLTQDEISSLKQPSLYGNGSAYDEPISTTYDLVRSVMAAPMPCLPQMEDYFQLSHVSIAEFDDFLKATRNILIVDLNPDRYTQAKCTCVRDNWSTPQAVCRIQAPSQEAFVAYWNEFGTAIRDWFVKQEIDRQNKFYRNMTNQEARTKLQNKWGCDMLICEDYMLIMDTTVLLNDEKVDFLWCCNSKGPIRRDLVLYRYPFRDADTFTPEYLNAKRDLVLGQLVTAQLEGSHMGTEYDIFPPQFRALSVQNNAYAAEIRGLWLILDGENMGGPYVSHSRVDEYGQYVVTAEVFIFASGQKKRNALRQAEAMLYTLKMPQELNALDEVVVDKDSVE
ncbi:MAG: DUF4837 family protein [Paludibacteraceae bacterium]|nr:DUF4837 family protein [Paludibacteraceae bacterium]